MFNSSVYCLELDTLIGWLFLQGSKLANIDHKKQYFSSFAVFMIAFDLKGVLT